MEVKEASGQEMLTENAIGGKACRVSWRPGLQAQPCHCFYVNLAKWLAFSGTKFYVRGLGNDL